MKVSGLVAGVLVAIGIAMGFFVGKASNGGGDSKSPSGEGAEKEGIEGKSGRYSAGPTSRGGGPEGKSGRSAASTIRRVARELEFSPMAQMDFDIMFETYEAIRWMTPEDIAVALAELDEMGGKGQSNMMLSMMLINLWAKQDGRGALEFALLSKNQMTKSMGVMGGMMGWVKNDPEGAYAWFQENKDTVRKNGGMMGGNMAGMMFAALAQRDMAGAFAKLDDLNRQEKKSALSMIGMQTMMNEGKRGEFIRELDKLEDAELQEQSLQSMVTMWAYQDPKGAITFLDSREWKDTTRDQLRVQVAASWANTDAEAALEWRMKNIGENEKQGDAIAGSFANWVAQDAESAQEWLEKQPAELRSDQIYQQTANTLQWRDNYEDAIKWADQIENVDQRKNTYRDIYRRWEGAHESAAKEWLGTLDAPTQEAVKAKAGSTQPFESTLDLQIEQPEPVKE